MSLIVKSGATSDLWTIDVTSKAGRVTLYDTTGAVVTPASTSPTGSAVPANAMFVGGTDGTNLRGIATDASGQVKVLVQNTPTVTVSGSVSVTQGTSPWVVSLTSTTITGTVAVTQSTSPWTVQGDSASGAANAGNPVKTGGVFNTTQPTVTNGQTVDSQSTARGASIVATGVDTFNVTVNAPLPAGTNVIGHVITDSGSTTVVTGTVAVTQSTSPWVVSLASTTITGTVAVTQSTSPWTIQGDSASGAAKAGNPVQIGGVFNTTQPTVTTGQTVEAQSTARGALIVATGTDAFNVVASGTVAVSSVGGTVAVTQSTSPWVVSLTSTTITGTVAVTQSTTPWTIQGDSASGAANAGNPVKGGGVFNTTQPTVTNGQTVDQQSTARGALIVAVGVDGFAVTGTVTSNQGTSPWVENLTQVAGVALGATAVTNFGSAPAAAAVPGVNASLFAGTTGITATGSSLNANVTNTVTVTGTVAATQSGNWTTRIVGNAGATLDGTVAAGTAPANGLAIIGQFNTTIPTPTAAQTLAIQLDSTGALAINTEGRKTTYRVGIVAFTPIASATAPTVSITGSATKTVRITRIVFSSSAATGTIADLQLLRFSALTGGTANSQAANVAKMDTNNAAQTAVVNQWSAAATTATSAGILNAKRYEVVTAAVSVQPGEIEWLFGNDNGQGLVLRGTGDFAGIRISAVGTTPVADCWVEWTEE